MRSAFATLGVASMVVCFGISGDAWSWGGKRIERGRARVERGKGQLNKAGTQIKRLGTNARRGVGYGMQVPGAAVSPAKGAGKTMVRKSGKGFALFGINLKRSVGNTFKGVGNVIRGKAALAVGHTQRTIGNLGSAIWNSKPVQFGRLYGSALRLGAKKAGQAMRDAAKPDTVARRIEAAGGAVPSRYQHKQPQPATDLKSIGAGL